jgi:hypothetical protein
LVLLDRARNTAKYVARRQITMRTSKLGEPQLLLASSRILKQGRVSYVSPAAGRCQVPTKTSRALLKRSPLLFV